MDEEIRGWLDLGITFGPEQFEIMLRHTSGIVKKEVGSVKKTDLD